MALISDREATLPQAATAGISYDENSPPQVQRSKRWASQPADAILYGVVPTGEALVSKASVIDYGEQRIRKWGIGDGRICTASNVCNVRNDRV